MTHIYHDATQYDLLAQMTAPQADVPFYSRQVARFGGPVLELGCGTGRVTLPLATSGIRVVGLDNSRELLASAKNKAGSNPLLTFVDADFCRFDLGCVFPLVLCPYNAFNHLLDFASLRSCLQSVHNHLGVGGRFVLDTFNPEPARLPIHPQSPQKILEYIDPYTSDHVVLTETNLYDTATQINEITWHYEVAGAPNARTDKLRMRVFYPQELDNLLSLSGFTIEAKYGDYDGSPFTSSSRKQLLVVAGA